MKKLNLVNKVFLCVSFACAILAIILSLALDEKESVPGVITISLGFVPALGVSLLLLAAVAGFVLMFTNKHYHVGLILNTFAMALLLCSFIYGLESDSVSIYVALIAVVFYIIYLILALIEWVLNKQYLYEDGSKVKTAKQIEFEISQWKELLDKEFITKEEFDAKRKSIIDEK